MTNNSDKASRVKLTPSKQVLQSSSDTPINQSVLDILGISPSPIKNTGADSKGEKRKGSGNEDSTHSLIKPTAPDAHAYEIEPRQTSVFDRGYIFTEYSTKRKSN